MYVLKPVVSLPDQIPVSNVMYELPSIQKELRIEPLTQEEYPDNDFSRQKNILEYHILEARQMKILRRVKELKQYVENLTTAVRLSNTVKLPRLKFQFSDERIKSRKNPIVAEAIINANPTKPPHSILALQRIWSDTKFSIDFHQHSTIINANLNQDNFKEKLLTISKSEIVNNINLKIIWKDVPELQFLTKIYTHPLETEVNLLRYLSRLIKTYEYENPDAPIEAVSIDTILDLSLQMSRYKSTNITPFIVKLASYLNKSKWLLNLSKPSIADVAVWSAIKQKELDKIPREIKRWYDLCEKTFLAN